MPNNRSSDVFDAHSSLRTTDNGKVEEDTSVKITETELIAGKRKYKSHLGY